MSKLRWAVGSVLALALIGAACGDDGGGDGDGGAAEPAQIAVDATEFAFTPDAFLAESGAEVTVTITNQGSVEHNWVLLSAPIAAESELDEGNVLFRVLAAPGGSADGTFTAPAPGDYQVICDIPGHFTAGMVGELSVTG